MKKITKLISIALCVILCTGIFAGCGKNSEETTKTTDGKNFTYWTVLNNYVMSAGLKSYNELLLFQELEKRTGVHIDFLHPIEGSTGNEAFMTMISSSERPDMIQYYWGAYIGGPEQAIEDEVIVCLNDYLEEHAPNYYDYLEGEKGKNNDYLYKLQASTEKGNYYGFNALSIGTTRSFQGIYARADKLKEWNMGVPETIDEWTAALAKAKSDGFKKPLSFYSSTLSNLTGSISFSSAFNVGKYFYLDGDKVVFGPFEKGYKEYIAQLAEWTKLGYIDTGFVTNDTATVKGNIVNNISFAAYGYISAFSELETAGKNIDPDFALVACPFPVAQKGDTPDFGNVANEAIDMAIGISPECGNIEAAIEWCDYIYSEEGSTLRTFGIEGDTYTVETIDGEEHFVYTDKILVPENSGVTSITEALYKYMLPGGHPGLNEHPDYLAGYYPFESQKNAVKVWNENVKVARKHLLPALIYTEPEAVERTDLLAVVQDELEVAITDIILGRKDISTYDAAIEKAKVDGFNRVLEITQDAYDRYASKLK